MRTSHRTLSKPDQRFAPRNSLMNTLSRGAPVSWAILATHDDFTFTSSASITNRSGCVCLSDLGFGDRGGVCTELHDGHCVFVDDGYDGAATVAW